MSNSTSEREQRLKEIRDGIANGWQTCGVAPNDPRMVQMKFETSEAAKDFVDRMANFDLPLSLLDSEAAGGNETPDHVWVELRSQHAFTVEPEPYVETVKYVRDTLFNEHYEALLRAALLREQAAATSMRDLCVEKVKAMAAQDRRFGAEYNLIRALGYDLVVTELQSLTLEQGQPVKEEFCRLAALIDSRERAAKRKLEQEQK